MRLFNNFKIYDEEECPCGSKKRYVECCKNRPDKANIQKNKKPPEVQAMEQFRKSLFKCCLYPDKTKCVKHIKEAHALQNNKIISKLAVDGHIYMLNPKKTPLIIPVENNDIEVLTLIDRVGVNNATTSTCFCDVHDDEVFASIEKGAPDFDRQNEEQKFIYAYKAFIFEYYKELVNEKAFYSCIKDKPSLLKNSIFVREYRNSKFKLIEMAQVKNFFDNGVLHKDYKGLETCVVEIPEQIKFANFACIGLNYDMDGKKIRNMKNKVINRLYLTVFPEDKRSYILVSCLGKDKKIYQKFMEQLQNQDINLIKYYFTLVLPLYSENIVLSPTLWEGWDEKAQMAFTFYSNRKGAQFAAYNQAVKFGLHNLQSKKVDLGNGKRGLIDIFG